MARYELAGTFWGIERIGTTLTITTGKVGAKGRTTTRRFASPGAAEAQHDQLVREKLGTGYRLVEHPAAVAVTPGAGADGAALEASIVADPADPAAYAVYADWLQHRGDPRGELIALQLAREAELARGAKGPSKLLAAIGKHVARHAATLLGGLAALVPDLHDVAAPPFVWRFGFIHRVVLERHGAGDLGAIAREVLGHPSSREELAIDCVVARAASNAGRVSALALKFDESEAHRAAVLRYIESLQETEHARRLGVITGPIAELGPQSIVQMFATTARRGTIYLRHAEEEGLICFEGGLLRVARIGPLTGLKALIRMLVWHEGTFEFHTGVDEQGGGDAPLPLEAALSEAVRKIDEGGRIDTSAFPLQARLVALHTGAGEFSGALSKVEEALLDVARAGFTIQRALEVIPEPDVEIFRALRALIDGDMVELR